MKIRSVLRSWEATLFAVLTADRVGLDGVALFGVRLAATVAAAATSSWAVGIDDVSASTHYVTGRSVNSFNSTVNNPGAFACIGYQQVVSPVLQDENVKFRTGSDTAGGDPMLGGDWLCTYRNVGDPEPAGRADRGSPVGVPDLPRVDPARGVRRR